MNATVQRSIRWTGLAIAALLVPTALGAMTGTAEAAKGGPKANSTPNSITLNQPAPKLGDWVTFTSVYPSSAKNPRVQVICRQNGVTVWATADVPSASFLLGGTSSDWFATRGAANCEADVFDLSWSGNNPQQVTMYATTFFDAAG